MMYTNFQDTLLKAKDYDTSSVSETAQMDSFEALKIELEIMLTKITTEPYYNVVEKELDDFLNIFKMFHEKSTKPIIWEEIELVPTQRIKDLKDISKPKDSEISDILSKLVVLKLNGGLGTSMGCVGPKSLIQIRDELTFLDLSVLQLEQLNNRFDTDVPLVLMNSFNTEDDTAKVTNRYKNSNVKIYMFSQKKFPRIIKGTLMPLSKSYLPFDPEAWYPPGHGDVYSSFFDSGLLNMFLQNGKSWLFVSNIDNLGATPDLLILKELESLKTCDFLMEVTKKTKADVKGGTLIKFRNKLTLLELAQVPKEKKEEFTSIQKFNIFNTNNLWINMEKMKKLVTQNKISMDIIINPKTLDNGKTVIQLEQAAGAAISSFDNAIGLLVPRSRFLPVKTTNDLLLIMSNLYIFDECQLILSPSRQFQDLPLIKLGPQFKTVKNFLSRFPRFPDLLELDHLTVFGDVKFGNKISLKGTVIIIAQEGDHIDIPGGAIIENKIVTGNLHILDH